MILCHYYYISYCYYIPASNHSVPFRFFLEQVHVLQNIPTPAVTAGHRHLSQHRLYLVLPHLVPLLPQILLHLPSPAETVLLLPQVLHYVCNNVAPVALRGLNALGR